LISAFLIAEAGAGVRLSVPRLSSSTFQEAVRKVVSNESYSGNAQRLGTLGRRAGGMMLAADALEAVAIHGSEHLQTLVDLNPPAANVWDVRAVMIAVPVGVVFFLWWSLMVIGRTSDASQAPVKLQEQAQSGRSARKKKA